MRCTRQGNPTRVSLVPEFRAMKLLLYVLVLQVIFATSATFASRKDRDAIIFPNPVDRSYEKRQSDKKAETKLAAWIRIAQALSQYDTVDDMNKHLNITDRNRNTAFALESRLGSERSNVEFPKKARCNVLPQVVPLIDPLPTSFIPEPPCTLINRCGGCCTHESLQCEPIETIVHNFEVKKFDILNDSSIVQIGSVVVPLEEHVECSCECKVKENDCLSRQIYIKEECRCACLNADEERKCSESKNKQWNPTFCSCFCKDTETCNHGYEFDQNTCSCKVASRRMWSGDRRTTGYNHPPSGQPAETPIIFPLNANDPRRKPKEDPDY